MCHHQAQVIHVQAVMNQQVIGAHHVVVRIVRELGVQAVARLAGFAVADCIGRMM